jgi:predicted permease
MLAVFGGAMAAATGLWASEALRRLLFPEAKWTASAVDPRTLAFVSVLAIVAGLASGLLPALQAAAPNLVDGLKRGFGRNAGTTRQARRALVVIQTALSLTLLVASGLLVRSMVRLNDVPLGFDPRGLVAVTTGRIMFGPPNPNDLQAEELAARVAASGAGAQATAITTAVPFMVTTVSDIKVIGSTFEAEPPDQPRNAAVSRNYFDVMRTRVLSGRSFADADNAGSEAVAIVSERMAQTYFGGPVPAGACLLQSGHPCARIVGVVEDVRDSPSGGEPPMRYYLPLAQSTMPAAGVIIRTDPANARSVASLVRSMLPTTQRSAQIELLHDRVSRSLQPWVRATVLFTAFGVLALVIACAGMYSVMSYMASERAQEIGIRVVLGASPSDVWALVLREGVRLALAGSVFGAVAAGIAGRYMGALLFNVSLVDPLIYAAATLGLLAASLLAIAGPARRASRIDPLAAVRAE